MKKFTKSNLAFVTILSLLLFAMIPTVLCLPSSIAHASAIAPLEELVVNAPNYNYSNNQFTMHGNYSAITKLYLSNIISNKSKIHIFYNANLEHNSIDNLPVTNNNACIYYYKNDILHVDTFLSNEHNENLRFLEIKTYIAEKVNKILSDVSSYSNDTPSQTFSTLYSGSMRQNKKPYGYIDIDWTVQKYRANNISSLYLVESHAAFTPGIVAMANDSSGYSTWKNLSGYLHIIPRVARFDVDRGLIRYGGTPVFKDAYPLNNPGTITISSTYNVGATLGYSFKNGFSLDNISIGQDTNLGLNISYSYNKSYTTTEPALSAQKSASNPQAYEWLYTYNTARAETNHLITGYMFELNNKGHDLLEGDLAFIYEYKMNVQMGKNIQSFTNEYIVEYV